MERGRKIKEGEERRDKKEMCKADKVLTWKKRRERGRGKKGKERQGKGAIRCKVMVVQAGEEAGKKEKQGKEVLDGR